MPAAETQQRTVRSTIAGTACEVTVSPCAMSALDTGEHLVGPDGATLFEVWTSCGEHGWLEVRNLSMTDDQAAARLAEAGAVEPGSDPRDGFFSHPADTLMDRAVSQQPA